MKIMKRLTALLLVIALPSMAVGCGEKQPAYENLLVTNSTVESDRFGLKFEAGDGFAVLVDEMLAFAGNVGPEAFLSGDEYTRGGETYALHNLAMATSYETMEYITFQCSAVGEQSIEEALSAYQIAAGLDDDVSDAFVPTTVCGHEGSSFTVQQNYEDELTGNAYSFHNVFFVTIQDGWLLMINCSGNDYPQNCIDTLKAQKIIK